MTETIRFTRMMLEDMDVGASTREVRLANNRVMLLQQIHLGALGLLATTTVPSSASAPTLSASNLILPGMRVMGVTTEILVSFGTTNSMTAFAVGDGTSLDRWGVSTGLTAGARTEQPQFLDTTWPVYSVETSVVLSALGGLFDAKGQLEVTVHYFPLQHRRAG